jgi:hypothetical protein
MGQLVFQATLGGQVNLVGPNTASTFNLNVPAVSSTLATLTGAETFTNKTLTSPTLTTPVLGTPASGTLTNCTSLPVGGITATGTPSSTTFLRGDSSWATIATNAITNGTSNVTVNSSGGSITAATNGTTAITVDASQNVTLTGGGQLRSNTTNAPVTFADLAGTQIGTLCRAWVSFTTGNTILGSFNVSSVTLPATGISQINFTNAMPDAKYVVVQSSSQAEDGTQEATLSVRQAGANSNYTTTAVNVACQTRLTNVTPAYWFVAIFR